MSHVAARAGPSTVTPSDGSRTVVLHDTQPHEGEENRNDVSSVLHLRGAPRTHPRVTWTEDVVDNEGMGKKKSKICCIYHKRRRFDESSSESESSDSDSGCAQPGGRLRQHRDHHHSHRSHPHPHPDPQNSESSGNEGGQAMRDGGGSVTVQELPDKCEPNAYERQPGKRKRGTVLDTDE